MKNRVDRFRLEYGYLSNFYPVCIRVEGLEYLSTEAAYQAAKCAKQEDRALFTELGSRDAKQLGRKLPLRADWEAVKVQEMEKIVRAKFAQNLHLARFLTETGDAELVEGNTWHDTFWGVDLKTGAGENHLGKILMALREEFQKNGLPEQDQPPRFRCETSEDGIQVQLRDITQIPCDCIVNATNETLLGSGGVDIAIVTSVSYRKTLRMWGIEPTLLLALLYNATHCISTMPIPFQRKNIFSLDRLRQNKP